MFRYVSIIFFVLFASLSVHAETVKVKLETTMGDIHIDLYADKAPNTVDNFLKYIDAGLMGEGSFYRAVNLQNQVRKDVLIEVIQGGIGGSDVDGYGAISLERTRDTGLKHLDGTISMARGGPDTATSEFFICINDQPSLDFGGERNADGQGFAAFGQVTKGMEVVRAIQMAPTEEGSETIVEPVKFISFTRE
ncbi:peptidylprolyl isomerase [Pseudemcibacter aquimaris]|uniref:peptidylprolyl isomerase n=1 Tax=Pseudemcibacter aquimaris TaxID=2857064 RepID=UPI002011A823|nr:peptidylprolyl isomerase [Pseudemcibacter aquimaris]MCC3860988.1 peptidylprolyl isomerase [Pseudemcibacter aquimaris]WDU59806.1 peptidylprolyl isomerase [Pseudemcibacter aquimaris]